MTQQFTSQDLYKIRNEVPLEVVISKVLKQRCEREGGYFRFSCPQCGGFHTAVNSKTNLGRCFDCEKNFNNIDMVMHCRRTGFVDSVKLLQLVHARLKEKQAKKSERHDSKLTSARAILTGLAAAATAPSEN